MGHNMSKDDWQPPREDRDLYAAQDARDAALGLVISKFAAVATENGCTNPGSDELAALDATERAVEAEERKQSIGC